MEEKHPGKVLSKAPEVARAFNISLSQVRKLTRAGKLEHVKLGRAVRYDLDALLQKSRES